MTIEDALGEIKVEDKDKRKTQTENQTITNQELIQQTQKNLGDYLTKLVSNGIETPGCINNFLQTWGPFVLRLTPTMTSTSKYGISVALVDTLDKETITEILKGIENGYLLNTDVKPENDIDIAKEGGIYIPEITSIRELVCSKIFEPKKYIHPYLWVMNLQPQHRPLITTAIDQSIKNKEIKIEKSIEDYTQIPRIILSYMPSTKSITETAKKHNITNIKEAMKDMEVTMRTYTTAWAKK